MLTKEYQELIDVFYWEDKSPKNYFKKLKGYLFAHTSAIFSQREADNNLKTTYLILLVILISCFIISFSLHANLNWLQDFCLDVASEIIGILLVVFCIDRVIDYEREKKRKKKEKVALQQLRRPILRHLYLFVNIFKESDLMESQEKNISNFLEKLAMKQISFFEVYSPASFIKSGQISWLDYLSWECSEFKESLNRTVEKYSLFLQPEVINLIEELVNSPFIWLTVQSAKIQGQTRNIGYENKKQEQGKANLLAEQEMLDLLTEHITKLATLVQLYNQKVSEANQIQLNTIETEIDSE